MPSRISLNADCRALGSNRQRFIDFIAALRPAYVLLMDDDKSEIADAIHGRSPETTIIHRMFTIHDGNLWNVPQADGTTLSPQEYLDAIKPYNRSYVAHQILNEPSPPKGVIAQGLKWLCELMKLGHEQNVRLCVLNMQSVAIRFDELDAGVYDEFLFCCARYASFHIIGYHEYGLADVSLNVSEHFMAYLATPMLPKPDTTWADVKPREAHIGRIQILVDRAKAIGALPLPPFVATEYGGDKVEIGQYQAVIGLNGGAIPYGLPSLRTYVERREHMPFDAWALEQFMWTDSVMPDYIKGFCWFGWNYNPEWAGFNIGELTPLQALWINYATSLRNTPNTPPSDPPTPIPQQPPPVLFLATPTLAEPTALNVRVSPSGQIIDSVKPGEPVSVIAPENASTLIGKDTQWVQVTTARNVTGWCAAWLLKRVEPPPVVTPQVNTDWRPSIVGVRREIMLQAKEGKLAETQGLIMDLVAIADSYAAEIQRLLGIINGK